MSTPQIDNVSAGYVFAYDDSTGEVLWTHEKIVEVNRGQDVCTIRITASECEQVRVGAARVFRGRKVKAMIAPEGFALSENMRITVDPKTQMLHEHKNVETSLSERFTTFDHGAAPQDK